MTSSAARAPATSAEATYVWTWLPGAVEPVVAGRLTCPEDRLLFNYGRSYLSRDDAIALYLPELPLKAGAIHAPAGRKLAGCLRDSAPDAWGRRVLLRFPGGQAGDGSPSLAGMTDELSYLMGASSDRVGALDFQRSASEYQPRGSEPAELEELLDVIGFLEQGRPLPPTLAHYVSHLTAAGGARPKALYEEAGTKYLAKFSRDTDSYPVVRAEFVAMRLAARAGLNVASVSFRMIGDRDVLLVTRFDRTGTPSGWQRHHMVSALTLLGLDEESAELASYQDLAEIIRHRFTSPRATLRELYGRMVFNILIGNTDDHARNYAAFWDGKELSVTPAYDICPQTQGQDERYQAMRIAGADRTARLATCLEAAHSFLLGKPEAIDLIEKQVEAISSGWPVVTDEAGLDGDGRRLLWVRQILNPYAFSGLEGAARRLAVPACELGRSPA